MIYDNFTILMIITITILSLRHNGVHLHMSAEPPFCSEDFMTWTQKLLVFYRLKMAGKAAEQHGFFPTQCG